MAQNQIGKIPDFTVDDGGPQASSGTPVITDGGVVEEEDVESTSQPADETAVEETETPEPPAEKPDDGVATVVESTTDAPKVDIQELQKTIAGLQEDRAKLIKDLVDLRGQKREIKQEQINRVDQHIDELKDLNPNDVDLIEKVLRAKGYVNKTEANQMFYKAVENEELNKFLEKYPEYKPENDPNDLNWTQLNKELALFKLPTDPKLIGQILERAHRGIYKAPSGPTNTPISVQKRKIEIASQGHGGGQRPSPNTAKVFDADTRSMLRNGGFTEEDIADMEGRR